LNGRYTIHGPQGYIEVLVEGRVAFSELVELIRKACSHPAWMKDLDWLMDLSAATVDLNDGEMRDLLNWMVSDPRCSFGRWAFIGGKTWDIRMARMATLFSDPSANLRVFVDRAPAEKWLHPRKPDPPQRGTKSRRPPNVPPGSRS